MGKLNNFLTLFLFLILLSSFAYSWSPQSDMDLRDTYDLYNATNITSEGDVCIRSGNCLSNISDVEILTSNYSSYSNSSSYLDNYSSSDFILSGDESNLNVNSSTYWDGENNQSNLNVNSSTWWASASSFISKWFYSNSGVLTLNETQFNISVEDVGNATYIKLTEESNLNVNSSEYWDNLNSPSDINAGDITNDGTYILSSNESNLNVNSSFYWSNISSTDNFSWSGDLSGTGLSPSVVDNSHNHGDTTITDVNGTKIKNMDITCSVANTYFTSLNFTNESTICTGITDIYLLNSGDIGNGVYNFEGMNLTGELDMHGNALTNSSTIQEVGKQGMVLGMNFNSETVTGTAGSETVLDSSGENNHGTNSGATFNESGGFNDGGAFEFDGVNDYIMISKGIINSSTDFTISAWVYNKKDKYTMILDSRSADNNGWHLATQTTEKFRSSLNAEDTVQSNGVLPINTWTHIVSVFDRDGNLQDYVNGIATGTPVSIVGEALNSGNLFIGRRSYAAGDYFNGSIDEVLIWNRSLSSNEIKSLYEQRKEVQNSYVSQKDIYILDGNIGIGTTNPDMLITINNSDPTKNPIFITQNAGANLKTAIDVYAYHEGRAFYALLKGEGQGYAVNSISPSSGFYGYTNTANTATEAFAYYRINNESFNQPGLQIDYEGKGYTSFFDNNGDNYTIKIDSAATTQGAISIEDIPSNKSLEIATNDKICMDGSGCSVWLKYNGSCIESSNGGCI